MTGRRREIRYDAPISGRIPVALKARLDAIADRNEIALGAVLRQVIEAGLPVVESERLGYSAGVSTRPISPSMRSTRAASSSI